MKVFTAILIYFAITINSLVSAASPIKQQPFNKDNIQSKILLKVQNDNDDNKIDAITAAELETLIKNFTRSIEEGKDFTQIVEQFCVPNYQQMMINLLLYEDRKSACNEYNDLSRDQVYKYYISNLNFFVLTFLYCASHYDLEHSDWSPDYIGGIPFKKRYPKEVVKILAKNSMLVESLDPTANKTEHTKLTLAEIQTITSDIDQAVILLRANLHKHRPAKSLLYQKNIQYLSTVAGFLELFQYKWYADDAPILSAGTETYFIRLPIPLKLNFTKVNGQYKLFAAIVSLCD